VGLGIGLAIPGYGTVYEAESQNRLKVSEIGPTTRAIRFKQAAEKRKLAAALCGAK